MSTIYTPAMEQAIRAAAPLNLAKAKQIAADFPAIKSHMSVITKARHMGVEYVKAAPAPKREVGDTKADIVAAIRKGAGLPDREGDLTKAELSTIMMLIP